MSLIKKLIDSDKVESWEKSELTIFMRTFNISAIPYIGTSKVFGNFENNVMIGILNEDETEFVSLLEDNKSFKLTKYQGGVPFIKQYDQYSTCDHNFHILKTDNIEEEPKISSFGHLRFSYDKQDKRLIFTEYTAKQKPYSDIIKTFIEKKGSERLTIEEISQLCEALEGYVKVYIDAEKELEAKSIAYAEKSRTIRALDELLQTEVHFNWP